jgi:hypothetical protein
VVKSSLFEPHFSCGPRHSSSGWSLASHRGGPASNPGLVKWDLWWTKWRWGRFSPSTSVSPANLHSTKFSIIIITQGKCGSSLDSTPHYANLKKNHTFLIFRHIEKMDYVTDMVEMIGLF